MRTFSAHASLAFLSMVSTASAQVIYAPTQYQYGTGRPFYYGGTEPAVIERGYIAAEIARRFDRPGRLVGSPVSGATFAGNRPPVYTDYFFGDASVYGYSAADAQNELSANLATYFRKRDLLPVAAEWNPKRVEAAAPVKMTLVARDQPPRGSIVIKPYVKRGD